MDETTLWIERKDSDISNTHYVTINPNDEANRDEMIPSPIFRETTV